MGNFTAQSYFYNVVAIKSDLFLQSQKLSMIYTSAKTVTQKCCVCVALQLYFEILAMQVLLRSAVTHSAELPFVDLIYVF